MEPLVIAGQGHFFTGLREHTGTAGTSVYGMHVQYQTPRFVPDDLVLVHGPRLVHVRDHGHTMMLEKNNAEIAAVITGWIAEHV